ncbi:DUF1761 domain-containing protein [Arthrobacter cupressi]
MEWLSHILHINWLAVLLAFVSSLVIGFLWYMPAVFGRKWMEAIARTEKELKALDGGAAVWVPMVAAAALSSILLAVLSSALGLDTPLAVGFFAFVAAVVFRAGGHLIHNGFAGRAAAVTLIDSGHDVLALTVAGAIIGALP